MRSLLVLILIAISAQAHAVNNSPPTPKLPADLLFYQSCRSHLIDMIVDQTPATKTNPFLYKDIYGKSGASCDKSRNDYNRNGWGARLKTPELSGCVEAILYAFHGKNDTEMGKLTVQYCNGLK